MNSMEEIAAFLQLCGPAAREYFENSKYWINEETGHRFLAVAKMLEVPRTWEPMRAQVIRQHATADFRWNRPSGTKIPAEMEQAIERKIIAELGNLPPQIPTYDEYQKIRT